MRSFWMGGGGVLGTRGKRKWEVLGGLKWFEF